MFMLKVSNMPNDMINGISYDDEVNMCRVEKISDWTLFFQQFFHISLRLLLHSTNVMAFFH